MCENHPSRRAKYIINKENIAKTVFDGKGFCSKCAITLVSKGYKVSEVEESENGIRSKEINRFIAKIEEVFERDQLILEKLEDKR